MLWEGRLIPIFFGNMTFTHNYSIIFLSKKPDQLEFNKTVLLSFKRGFLYGKKNPTTSHATTVSSLPWRLYPWKAQPESNKKIPNPTAGEDENRTWGLEQNEKMRTGFQSPCDLYLWVGLGVSWLGGSDKVWSNLILNYLLLSLCL